MVSQLGYGTLTLSPSGPNILAYDNPSATKAFCYDTTANTAEGYLNSGWTQYLQLPVNNNSLWSIQNMLALQLKGDQTVPLSTQTLTSNWQSLVALNFFRPRNWAFNGFLDASTSTSGVTGLALASDQPNATGLYEFLVPDPYFAASPIGPNIIGQPLKTFVGSRQGPDYNLATQLIYGSQGTLSPALSVSETSTTILSQILVNHKAFHYWTNLGSTATLDLFVNVSALFQSAGALFDWSMVQFDQEPYSASMLAQVLGQFALNKSDLLSV
jgi:hypothetical protein